MNHDSLVTALLTAHGALLVGLLAAYYKYGDRNDNLAKSLQGIDALLTQIRRRISGELGVQMSLLLNSSNSSAIMLPVLGPRGETYTEQPVDLTKSEAFKENLQKFLENHSETLLDYRLAVDARRSWCKSAKTLSWCLLVSLEWTFAATGFIFAMERCMEIPLSAFQLRMIFLASATTIAAALLTLPWQLIAHDKLISLRVKYDSP